MKLGEPQGARMGAFVKGSEGSHAPINSGLTMSEPDYFMRAIQTQFTLPRLVHELENQHALLQFQIEICVQSRWGAMCGISP